MPQVVLTIGGSDSGGGAGIQADLKTFCVLGLHGTSPSPPLLPKTLWECNGSMAWNPSIVVEQMRSITDDFSVAFAKTGMLHSAEIVTAVAHHLQKTGYPLRLRSGDRSGSGRQAAST